MSENRLEGVCPECGYSPLSFYFAPNKRSCVLEWRDDGTPQKVAMVLNDFERPTREVSREEIEVSEQAMKERRGGATLNCTGCGRWIERAKIKDAR